ncbi:MULTISPECIES: TetR/AcrR family transcriptional regulator [unclassified Pseudofrankia]|uniref:TetR/AcrR family transcriptional regulator n=1 Tax=unclassified Pseudofrankia TaxID=2994372 RepID=UPI0008D958D2|nr:MULTISPECIES: TetR/AcrR family transcriptional regulator [unclassified Pseudofrankia]MDT3440767.1 TetR/AcrR family transcriptional regulator [Pseudofrankia sp. BMG5.37]OHV64729.1 TetR family transcriptional regulator [Pseudofrankia sp. BMG5.36]
MSSQPTRADARHNRELILTAARAALSEDGSASLSAIARRAGVGIATLYRRFPTREALVMELYRNDIGELIDLAPALLAEHPPLEALGRWFDEVARYARLKFGVSEVVHAATNGGLDDPAYEPFVAAIATLLTAGEKAGALKPGLDPEDVLLQLSVLWRIDPKSGDARIDRILALILDGLRAR